MDIQLKDLSKSIYANSAARGCFAYASFLKNSNCLRCSLDGKIYWRNRNNLSVHRTKKIGHAVHKYENYTSYLEFFIIMEALFIKVAPPSLIDRSTVYFTAAQVLLQSDVDS